MTTTLKVNGKELTAKCVFKFERHANENYSEADEKGKKTGGFMNLVNNLLEFDTTYVTAFWDCALEYLGKDKPSEAEIEEAIEARIEEDGDTEKLVKEAYNELTESGFFKLRTKKYWKNLEVLKTTGKTEEEKAENLKMYNLMQDSRKAMKA